MKIIKADQVDHQLPKIIYSNDKNKIDSLFMKGFFVDWPNPPTDLTLRKILHNSQFIYLALNDNKLVGFINGISDQVLSTYIPLLEVLPEYQGKGIGQGLVTRMMEELKGIYMIDICCDEDVIPFYEKNGFRRGHSVIKRNYDRQSGE
jgi:GNAT superfamily N-acetyltransferase